MALTQKEIMALVPNEKRQQYGCGSGLLIVVEPIARGGGKSFDGRMSIKKNGTTIRPPLRIGTFGSGPGQYSLKQALQKWNEIKVWAIKEGKDFRQFGKESLDSPLVTLKDAIDAFLLSKILLKEHTLKNYRLQLENQVLSIIDGTTLLQNLEWDRGGRQRVIEVRHEIERRGSFDQANRVQKVLAQCFDFAIDNGWMNRHQNPALNRGKDVTPNKETHHPTISWAETPQLLQAINLGRSSAHIQVLLGVKFLLMTFLRAGALVRLEWDWIDTANNLIIIPGETPGLKRTFNTRHLPHHVPITPEMGTILEHAWKLSSGTKYVFPSYRQSNHPHLGPEALNRYLINLGYKGVLTAHGWRSVPLTVGQEQLKISHEIIQRQMGHLIGDKVRKAYDNSLMLDERREFLEQWCLLLVENGLKL